MYHPKLFPLLVGGNPSIPSKTIEVLRAESGSRRTAKSLMFKVIKDFKVSMNCFLSF
jgi:hypothetical protein